MEQLDKNVTYLFSNEIYLQSWFEEKKRKGKRVSIFFRWRRNKYSRYDKHAWTWIHPWVQQMVQKKSSFGAWHYGSSGNSIAPAHIPYMSCSTMPCVFFFMSERRKRGEAKTAFTFPFDVFVLHLRFYSLHVCHSRLCSVPFFANGGLYFHFVEREKAHTMCTTLLCVWSSRIICFPLYDVFLCA